MSMTLKKGQDDYSKSSHFRQVKKLITVFNVLVFEATISTCRLDVIFVDADQNDPGEEDALAHLVVFG